MVDFRQRLWVLGILALVSASLGAPASAVGANLPSGDAPTRFVLQVPVLYYHHVRCAPAGTASPELYICPDRFAAQMTYLHDQGWHTITTDQLADLVAARQCPDSRTFVASFDDGPVDQYDNAAPILESLGMRGTFFVVTGTEDELRTGKISWDGLRDLLARGHAIGNHTKTHQNLRKLSAAGLYDEIEGAQQILESQLGFRPRTFAYPYGRYNDAALAQVASTGFELAFTVHAGAREASDVPYLSKRIAAFQQDSGADVLAELQPFVDGCRPATPDVAISTSNLGPWKGQNLHYSVATKAQTLKRIGVRVGQTYHFWVRLDNEAQRAGSFRVTTTTSEAGMSVRYFVGGVDRTTAITGGGYATTTMDPWSSMLVDVAVTPTHKLAGASTTTVVRATSAIDPSRIDVVRLIASF